MATVTLKNVPEELLEKIRGSAAANRRSMNSEIIVSLESVFEPRRSSADDTLERIRRVRDRVSYPPLSLDEIEGAISKGRP